MKIHQLCHILPEILDNSDTLDVSYHISLLCIETGSFYIANREKLMKRYVKIVMDDKIEDVGRTIYKIKVYTFGILHNSIGPSCIIIGDGSGYGRFINMKYETHIKYEDITLIKKYNTKKDQCNNLFRDKLEKFLKDEQFNEELIRDILYKSKIPKDCMYHKTIFKSSKFSIIVCEIDAHCGPIGPPAGCNHKNYWMREGSYITQEGGRTGLMKYTSHTTDIESHDNSRICNECIKKDKCFNNKHIQTKYKKSLFDCSKKNMNNFHFNRYTRKNMRYTNQH